MSIADSTYKKTYNESGYETIIIVMNGSSSKVAAVVTAVNMVSQVTNVFRVCNDEQYL